MSACIDLNKPGYRRSRWITSEDVNVEHLLDVFKTIDANSNRVWDTRTKFMEHLFWHKKRLIILEGLPDDHHMERKRLLIHTLKLWREQRSGRGAARVLRHLSQANRNVGHYKEEIQQAEETSEIFKHFDDVAGQARCSMDLARLLYSGNQLDVAEEAASRAISLFSEEGQQHLVCESHRILGDMPFEE